MRFRFIIYTVHKSFGEFKLQLTRKIQKWELDRGMKK